MSPIGINPDVARQRSRVAVAHRQHDPAAITVARRDLAEAKLADYITRTVDAAPALTTDQRDRLAALLRGGGTDG